MTRVAMPFADRSDVGRRLAEQAAYVGRIWSSSRCPGEVSRRLRGGVGHLRAPLDVVVVRKLGVPFQPELAMAPSARAGRG